MKLCEQPLLVSMTEQTFRGTNISIKGARQLVHCRAVWFQHVSWPGVAVVVNVVGWQLASAYCTVIETTSNFRKDYKYTWIKLNCTPTSLSQVGCLCDTYEGNVCRSSKITGIQICGQIGENLMVQTRASQCFVYSQQSAYAEHLIACGCVDGKWGVYLDFPVKNG